MSNRRQSAYREVRDGPLAGALGWHCPDCLSERGTAVVVGAVVYVEVHHDPGCPWLTARLPAL